MTGSKKVYLKAYTKLNLGDDLFVFILCSRYPNTEFYLKEHHSYTDVFKSIKNLTLLKDTENIQFDAMVYIGGSIFMERSPASIAGFVDLKKEIVRENIPTFIIGANFGPYTSNEYFLTVKNNFFPYINSITFRDNYSYNLFKDMQNVHYAPDVVFAMDTDSICKVDNKEIGISIIHHLERENLKQYYSTYIDKILEISRYYISMGYTVRLFSFCEYEKDMVAINDLLSKMSKYELQHVVISNYTGNIQELLSKIASLKLFITSRFHSMILGLKFNIPIIPICYSPKCTNVLNDLGFPKDNIYTFENLDCLKYFHLPEVFFTDVINKAPLQFNDLDAFLNNKEL